jgi:hypothetical protein
LAQRYFRGYRPCRVGTPIDLLLAIRFEISGAPARSMPLEESASCR